MKIQHGRQALVMILAVLALLGLAKAVYAEAFPSDRILMSSFVSHRADYERLRDMVTRDMHSQPIFPEDNLSAAIPRVRRDEYRALLSSIPPVMVTVDYNRIVRFVFAVHGSAIGPESLKGIEYVPAGARVGASMVQNLNNPEQYAEGVYLRPIRFGWFVLFQRTD
jgi:hypothetical protein